MKLLIIDTETDSPKANLARIMEVAVGSVDLETGSTELLLDSLVRPDGLDTWRSCWFMENSGIACEAIEAAPPFAQIKGYVEELLKTGPATAYNLPYDLQVLYRHGLRVPQTWPCLMHTCTPICRLPGRYGDYKYPKFSEAYAHFFPGETFQEKHRAGYDVLHEAKLAYALYKGGYLRMKFI